MATPIFLSPLKCEAWDDVMIQMEAFVNDTNADIDMAYDWVCEMLDIPSFVDNEIAWDSFYNCWESCDNRNDLNTFQMRIMHDIFNNLNQELANLSIYKPVTNPYVENLIEMGYDRADCETVAVAGVDKTFPLNILWSSLQHQAEYDEALADFINGQ